MKNLSFMESKPKLSNYLIFLSAETVSLLGSVIVDFVLIWWVTITTNSAFYLAAASFITFGIQIILSPVAGVYVDRWNRKWVIGLSDFGQAIAMFYLLYKFSIGQAVVNDVLFMLLIGSAFQAFQGPAVQAIVPLMVEERNISRVNSLSYFSNIFTKVIGAPIGAFLLAIWPVTSLLWIDIITFFFANSILIFITIPSHKKPTEESDPINEKSKFVNDFKEGLSIIKSKGLIGFFFVFPITNFFETPRGILLPLLINYTYSGDALLFALIISSFQLTVSITAILMSWKNIYSKADPAKVVLFGILGIFAGSIFLVIPTPGLLGFYAIFPILGMVIMGICSPSVNITMMSLKHKIVPPDKLGRVSSTSSAVSVSMIPPATILTGIITDFLGNQFIRFIIFTTSIMGIIAMISIWFLTDLSNINSKLQLNNKSLDAENHDFPNQDQITAIPDI